jgi:hypothetical protein
MQTFLSVRQNILFKTRFITYIYHNHYHARVLEQNYMWKLLDGCILFDDKSELINRKNIFLPTLGDHPNLNIDILSHVPNIGRVGDS